ncbi:hypothetical protein [Thalassotalea euphylliae]|uniref:DUF2897 family protein n=1 Tax=Thalassotalea euphylliae TaxID=1655234 RepID=A0A3E0TZI4_9GAMM|nr:hypothetical protein [Thalassotalea euphylliae]REL29395.1 hypothetical protein DXX94_00920 [Thalassotalea euphylliae]REL35425.1 hypothetical protein DXX92_08720 [Thalassotalea euphylliae]
MDNHWVVILIIVAVFLFIVGNFSTVHKTAQKPMRKKGLNDLEETLPRSPKKAQDDALPSFNKTKNL